MNGMLGGPFSNDGDPGEDLQDLAYGRFAPVAALPDAMRDDLSDDDSVAIDAVDELFAAMPDDERDPFGGCNTWILAQISDERHAQKHQHKHDPHDDAALPLHVLPATARDYLQIAIDRLHGDRTDLPRARKKLVQAAALIVAALEAFPPTETPA